MEYSELVNVIKAVLRRPIAYHRVFAELAGKTSAGVMLSQAWYWSHRTDDDDGWFYKTRDDWFDETGMTRTEQETARKRLLERGLLEEKLAGMPGKMHYRVNVERIVSLLAENPPTGRRKTYQQAGRVSANMSDENPPTDPYIDSETTTETKSDIDIDVVLIKPSDIRKAVDRIFEFWRQLFADLPKVDTSQWQLTRERRDHITARFRSELKWTERKLQEALRGMRITPHNLGENPTKTLYIDPTTCFRNDTRVDKYRQTWLEHERAEEEKKTAPARKPSFSLPPNLKPANGEWEIMSKSMRSQMKDQTFEQWWAPLQCLGMQHEGDMFAFFVNAPNQLVKDWVTNNYIKLIEKALTDANLDPPSVEFCWLIGGDYVR